ncbi:MAG: hypothetical protein SOR57_12550 [Parabacteroides sp.]|nr:hypothetical protein [Parabacteroides sp.]
MKKTFFALFMSVFALTAQAQGEKEVFQGKWDFNAPTAPYGYNEGELTFQQKNGKLTAIVELPNTDLNIQQLKKENFGYSCTEYIDGSEVTIKFIKVQENGKTSLKVVAEADGQVMDVKLKRK